MSENQTSSDHSSYGGGYNSSNSSHAGGNFTNAGLGGLNSYGGLSSADRTAQAAATEQARVAAEQAAAAQQAAAAEAARVAAEQEAARQEAARQLAARIAEAQAAQEAAARQAAAEQAVKDAAAANVAAEQKAYNDALSAKLQQINGTYQGYTTGSSENLGATPDNINGYDPKSPALTERANQMADYFNSLNPNTQISPMDALASILSVGKDPLDNKVVSPNGYTYGEVKGLEKMGYGSLLGANANNQYGQTINNVLAAQTVSEKVMPFIGNLAISSIPNGALAMTLAKEALAVYNGDKSIEQSLKDLGLNYIGNKLAGAINTQVVKAVGPSTYSNLQWAGALSGMLGGPKMPNVGNIAVGKLSNALGLSPSSQSSSNSSIGASDVGGNPFANFTSSASSGGGGGNGWSVKPTAAPASPPSSPPAITGGDYVAPAATPDTTGNSRNEWIDQSAGAIDYVSGNNTSGAIGNLLQSYLNATGSSDTNAAAKAAAKAKAKAPTGSIAGVMDTIVGGKYNPDKLGIYNGFSQDKSQATADHGWFS